MLPEFEKKLADYIKGNELFGSGDKILLAVSGGADSTALLYAISSLRENNVLKPELHCAHINHRLRANLADADENFVIEQASNLKIAVTTKRVNVRRFAAHNKLSIETAARQLRIKNLIEAAKANNCNIIATAHQKNDNAETILQRLSRGTGYRGLGGIWPTRIFNGEFIFVRPFLCFERNEIIKYLQKRNLKWRHDHTNADCTYRRNYIRHRLLPDLQKDCTGSLIEQLYNLSESARRFYQLVSRRADGIWPEAVDCAAENITLDSKILLAQPQPVVIELLRRCLTAVGCGEKNLTRFHYEKLLQLARQKAGGKKMDLPGECLVHTEYGSLILSPAKNKSHPAGLIEKNIRLNIPGKTRFGGRLIEAALFQASDEEFAKFRAEKTMFVERFDFNKIKPPLLVRFRKTGDRFVPFGLSGKKKVGKFITAAKVPHHLRKKLLIVADAEKIIWLWPVRTCRQTKINGQTRKILQLKITNIPE